MTDSRYSSPAAPGLSDWFAGDAGRYVLAWETAAMDTAVADLAGTGSQLSPLTGRAFLAMCRQDGVKAALEAFKHTKQARRVHRFWCSRQATW
jgi:hypothetical protein